MTSSPASPSPRPTLLVFTLSPTGESGRRPLLPARLRGAEVGLRRAWLQAALAAGRQTGCRLMVCSPRPAALGPDTLGPDVLHLVQRGASFGERLAGAFEAALAAAEGPVVMVGSDAPGLSAEHVRGALDRLEESRESVVVGPSHDGGLYLLAAAAPIPGLASRVRWCRRTTFASLSRLLVAVGRERLELDELRDLDRPRDLDRWLTETPTGSVRWAGTIRQILHQLAAWRRPLTRRTLRRARLAVLAVPAMRGPPAPSLPTR